MNKELTNSLIAGGAGAVIAWQLEEYLKKGTNATYTPIMYAAIVAAILFAAKKYGYNGAVAVFIGVAVRYFITIQARPKPTLQ